MFGMVDLKVCGGHNSSALCMCSFFFELLVSRQYLLPEG